MELKTKTKNKKIEYKKLVIDPLLNNLIEVNASILTIIFVLSFFFIPIEKPLIINIFYMLIMLSLFITSIFLNFKGAKEKKLSWMIFFIPEVIIFIFVFCFILLYVKNKFFQFSLPNFVIYFVEKFLPIILTISFVFIAAIDLLLLGFIVYQFTSKNKKNSNVALKYDYIFFWLFSLILMIFFLSTFSQTTINVTTALSSICLFILSEDYYELLEGKEKDEMTSEQRHDIKEKIFFNRLNIMLLSLSVLITVNISKFVNEFLEPNKVNKLLESIKFGTFSKSDFKIIVNGFLFILVLLVFRSGQKCFFKRFNEKRIKTKAQKYN